MSVAAIITGTYSFQAGNLIKLNDLKTSIAIGPTQQYWSPSHPNAVVVTIFIPRPALVALVICIMFFAFTHQTFYVAPAVLMPKLYVNTIYMVLNSRIRIMGGQDIYKSSTAEMNITNTMIIDITSQPTEGVRPTDGLQGRYQ
ncbi:uncharacterized protein ARMOST_08058 [Armillaria ostoyae]|uniref:Uncharacterized protein n=1 Tax=Armillaria ostoyae TaxID=47428 RepID=A0A284R7H8_ARMOS|nr:uncharacterized protein ARMOST_08058 [Armillaria ostoyae]